MENPSDFGLSDTAAGRNHGHCCRRGQCTANCGMGVFASGRQTTTGHQRDARVPGDLVVSATLQRPGLECLHAPQPLAVAAGHRDFARLSNWLHRMSSVDHPASADDSGRVDRAAQTTIAPDLEQGFLNCNEGR